MIFNIVAILIILSIIIMLFNASLTSQYVSKIISLHSITSYIIVFICLLAVNQDNPYFIDVAIIYAIISIVATIGFLKYVIDKGIQNNSKK